LQAVAVDHGLGSRFGQLEGKSKGPFEWLEQENLRLYGQAIKRTWWMPWQLEAMKDVVGYEKPRGAAKQALIRGCPNGETHPIYRVSLTEFIG
jgi:hypothetical protein